jgi:hypothetical protein
MAINAKPTRLGLPDDQAMVLAQMVKRLATTTPKGCPLDTTAAKSATPSLPASRPCRRR